MLLIIKNINPNLKDVLQKNKRIDIPNIDSFVISLLISYLSNLKNIYLLGIRTDRLYLKNNYLHLYNNISSIIKINNLSNNNNFSIFINNYL